MMLRQDILLDLCVVLGPGCNSGLLGTFRTDWQLIVGQGKSVA
jgi:hypothetical protein